MRLGTFILATALALASHASADRVHLVSGSVIEGHAVRQGDKVVVQVESGEVALPADAVERIESGPSDVQRVEGMYAKLRPGDVQGLLRLANYCRDHDMPSLEHRMLERVIDVAADNPEARERLGYVRTPSGWVKHEDQLRAQGMVQYEGQWMPREKMLELERLRAQTEAAVLERDRVRAEAKKAESEAKVAQAQARASEQAAQAQSEGSAAYSDSMLYTVPWSYGYAAPFGAGAPFCKRGGVDCGVAPGFAPPRSGVVYPLPGMRDPFDYFRSPETTPALPGVRDPFDYFRSPPPGPAMGGARRHLR